ncbi:MAG: sulfotransferase domain-containing protein [Chloroflexota bacterium]
MNFRSLRFTTQWLRWRFRRMQIGLRYPQLDAPVFFGNSFPKSGTHLLTQVLAGFAQLGPVVHCGLPAITMFNGFTGHARPIEKIKKEITRYQPGDIGYGHLHSDPEIVSALCQPGVAPFFIYRDPRDVVVSHVFYVTNIETAHIHHAYYANELKNFDERLTASILGRPELQEIPFPGIKKRFDPYLDWLARPEVLSLRFEDFIADKEKTLGVILDHAIMRGFAYKGNRQSAIQILAQAIDPKKSPTFRSGKVGSWREYFKPTHAALFKEQAGELLIKLGYEKSLDW